jgi:hypothetical protein
MFETLRVIGKRPLVVVVERWGLGPSTKGVSSESSITWAQVWNRAAIIAAEHKHAERAVRGSTEGKVSLKGDK